MLLCRPAPVLRHVNGVGHPLSTDAHLRDRRLDLRPATCGRPGDRARTAPSKSAGLFDAFQLRGRRQLCLSLCPGYLFALVTWRGGVARRRARLVNAGGWFEFP